MRNVGDRALRWRALWLAALLGAAATHAAAQQPVPPLTGHVVDTTGTLTADAVESLISVGLEKTQSAFNS